MSKGQSGSARRPATKLPHLQKKLQAAKVDAAKVRTSSPRTKKS